MIYKILGNNIKENFIDEVLINRGIKKEDINDFINTTSKHLSDATDLDNIEQAATMFRKHVYPGSVSKVLLIVDCDADGITSAALIFNFIQKIVKDFKIDYAIHEGKQHGISKDLHIVGNYELEEYDFIIIPDASSNDYTEHQILTDQYSTDILVLDHHDAELGYSEYACVVNNQLSEKYKNKKLSGVGIVWQFVRYYIAREKITSINAEYFLDLVALGNIADVMDMRSLETKYLVEFGGANVNNFGFKALCDKQEYSMKGKVNPMTVGWYIAPLINAVLRSGTLEEKQMLFKSFIEKYAETEIPSKKRGAPEGAVEKLAIEFSRIASNVRTRQNKIVDAGIILVDNIIKEKELLNNKILLIKLQKEDLPAEVVGLVANKIASKYQMPTLILREVDDIYLKGSGRNFENSPLEDMKDFLLKSNLMEFVEGHASAHGASLKKENMASLIEYCNNELKDITFEAVPSVDFVFDFMVSPDIAADYSKRCVLQLGEFNDLWGQGVSEPLLAFKNLDLEKCKITLMSPDKKPTLKIEYDGLSFIKFGSDKEEYEEISTAKNKSISILGKANVNEWLGRQYPQILVQEYEIEKVFRF